MNGRCILGLNKYSQSASCAIIGPQGEVLFALARERLTRKKFDGGDVAQLVRYALDQTGMTPDDIGLVVENCHLFRIDAFEPRLPFTVGQHYYPASYLDELNFVAGRTPAAKIEITHHMAHAYGALLASPFEEGVIVVMDGMGSLRRDVMAPAAGAYMPETASIAAAPNLFSECPPEPNPAQEWREAESAYLFSGRELKRLFKRWSLVRTPSLLHNYGFENMDSLGAVYSRIASQIFKDWNACGKVMGLAGYGQHDSAHPLMCGPLEELWVNWEYLDALTPADGWDAPDSAQLKRTLAATVQQDLETIGLDFLVRLRERTGARNLILTGGVALNSQMNARVAAEAGYDRVFVPSAPGDDGVALGCAAFGLYASRKAERRPRKAALSPYLGGCYSEETIALALEQDRPRICTERPSDLIAETARMIADGKVVGWFQGRSEYGPRALGNRSILAHPSHKEMVERLNRKVKFREPFRPFAPTVLAEHANEIFVEASPGTYMSFAVPVRPERRDAIEAIVHVDQTARLQHLERGENPLYYDLISAFYDITGLPLVLNTSFNTAGDAIVETPADALATLLSSEMDALVIGPFIVTRRPFPAAEAFGRVALCANGEALVETVSQATGELSGATLYYRGKGFELGETALGILDAAASPVPIATLLEEFSSDASETEEVLAELRRLYDIGAVVASE